MIKNSIIPEKIFYIKGNNAYDKPPLGEELDLKSITLFLASGFFFGNRTFFNDVKFLRSGEMFSNGKISKSDFNWYYEPRNISFDNAVCEFTDIFESVIRGALKNKEVILPLSGGLDSRTIAIATKKVTPNVKSYSYSFDGGIDENIYAEKIAHKLKIDHRPFLIKNGYLWKKIDELAMVNGCYAEFTHPRQMAFIDEYSKMGNIFCLGHWGDVLFDNLGLPDNLSYDKQVHILKKSIIKDSGYELAVALWEYWNLNGNFIDYFNQVLSEELSSIKIIKNANAKIRAFKSLHWAPRWNRVNLSIFEKEKPIFLPYYNDKICEFICTIPEKYLSNRKIQIEYIKRESPELAKLVWQEHRPFNLYNYHWDKTPWNIPYRLYDKVCRITQKKKFVQRNWELQFLGKQNEIELEKRLFQNKNLNQYVPKKLVERIYKSFLEIDSAYYSHSLSMVLTLGQFFSSYNIKSQDAK